MFIYMKLQGGGLAKRRSEESKIPKSSQARLSEMKQQLRKYSNTAEKAPDAELDSHKTKKQPLSLDGQRAIKPTEDPFQRPQDEPDRDSSSKDSQRSIKTVLRDSKPARSR
jgi:hypothetical protein